MEVTPDLLVLLKQLLEFCSREAEKRKEDPQAEEQLNAIVAQIKKILEAME
ncbi:hypothetical protein Ruko_09720 [Ruthenibacterium sp. TH_2024_36131]|uniref:hypothetical protein n=1 Tax=Owariibacterium komagatae TaxID=3136601 RepID=UPI0038B32221